MNINVIAGRPPGGRRHESRGRATVSVRAPGRHGGGGQTGDQLVQQFYQALKLRKIDTAPVRVPNASHDISARPSLLIDKVAYVLAWFRAHDAKPT
jgi:hypothetical protein